jgi:hypothetical protein
MAQQDIINFLKENGPTTPAQYAKHINTSLLFASAMLGEVSSKGVIKISNLKIGGGSPLYYLKEQADQLQRYSNNLNSKDKEGYEKLKEKQILRDKEQSPIIRIALRTIKDFAIPLNIIRNDEQELFWKWYLTSDDDAKNIIQDIFNESKPKASDESINKQPTIEKSNAIITTVKENKIETEKPDTEIKVEAKTNNTNNEQIKEKNNKSLNNNELNHLNNKKKIEIVEQKLTNFESKIDLNNEFKLLAKTGLQRKIVDYFENKQLTIISYSTIKKNKEYNFILEVPSAVGKAKFFCKAVDKKKIDEKDLALALIEGQNKQLPVLFMSTGDLNKKTQEMKDILFKDLNYVSL